MQKIINFATTSIIDPLLLLWQGSLDLERLLLICAFLGLVLLGCEVCRARLNLAPELTRKTIHIVSGTLACTFPWVFHSAQPIAMLAISMSLLFLASRYFKWLPSLFGINRRSGGDLYFIFSVWALFVLTTDHRLYYVISLLTLSVADALAALLGKTYQKITYAVEEHFKSLEGSAVFFLATFLCVHIPLLVFSDIGRLESILIALELAILVTSLESISLGGIDNLIIPLSTYYILNHPLSNAAQIGCRLGVLITITLSMLYIGGRLRVMAIASTLVMQLFLYSLYALHSYDWLIPASYAIALFIIIYHALMRYLRDVVYLHVDNTPLIATQRVYQVIPTFYLLVVPTAVAISQDLCLRLQWPIYMLTTSDLYPLFIASICIALAQATTNLLIRFLCNTHPYLNKVIAIVCAMTTLLICPIFIGSPPYILCTFFSTWLACYLQQTLLHRSWWPSSFPWVWRNYALTNLSALLILWGPTYYFF